MDVIARYPEFSPLSLEAVQAIRPDLQLLKDGMSELTFGSLYFCRNFYKYKISRFNEHTLIFLGEERKTPFFFTIGDPIPLVTLKEQYDLLAKEYIRRRREGKGFTFFHFMIDLAGGPCVAKRLSGFGCKTIFYDIKPNLSDELATQVSLQELQENADILSLHTPLTEDTLYMIDEEFISKMKKNFYFINTARGKNLKTSALVNALKSGKIKGACLDVLEYEKTSFENLETKNEDLEYLLNSEKAIITPHIAGWTHESKIKLAQVIVDKILAFTAEN